MLVMKRMIIFRDEVRKPPKNEKTYVKEEISTIVILFQMLQQSIDWQNRRKKHADS